MPGGAFGGRLATVFLALLCQGAGNDVSTPRRDWLERVLDEETPSERIGFTHHAMKRTYIKRLHSATENTKSNTCRRDIERALFKHVSNILEERPLPSEGMVFRPDCSDEVTEERKLPDLPVDPSLLRFCYVLIVHKNAEQVIRLVKALMETTFEGGQEVPMHLFVIHVDKKKEAEKTFQTLATFASTMPGVIMVPDAERVSMAWGGFSIVQGTLNAMALALFSERPWHYLINLSGQTYPIVDSVAIRERIAEYPYGTNFVAATKEPARPQPDSWFQYVECDGQAHRIGTTSSLLKSHSAHSKAASSPCTFVSLIGRYATPRNLSMYLSSQWITLSRDFTHYVLTDTNLAKPYAEYAKRIVIADENFFSTVLLNSPFCHTIVYKNNHHIQFDEWESSKAHPDQKKCLQPGNATCGRSPTTMTLDYLPILDLASKHDIFARKFDPKHDEEVLDYVDDIRASRAYQKAFKKVFADSAPTRQISFLTKTSLRMLLNHQHKGLYHNGAWSRIHVTNVSIDTELDVAGNLAKHDCCKLTRDDTQAVVTDEKAQDYSISERDSSLNASLGMIISVGNGDRIHTPFPRAQIKVSDACLTSNRYHEMISLEVCDTTRDDQLWTIGPCSRGTFAYNTSSECLDADALVAGSDEVNIAPLCVVKQVGSFEEEALCLDVMHEGLDPGKPLITYPCTGKWNQLFAFGGDSASCSMHVRIPSHYVKNRLASRKTAMCFREEVENSRHLFTVFCDDSGSSQKWGIRVF